MPGRENSGATARDITLPFPTMTAAALFDDDATVDRYSGSQTLLYLAPSLTPSLYLDWMVSPERGGLVCLDELCECLVVSCSGPSNCSCGDRYRQNAITTQHLCIAAITLASLQLVATPFIALIPQVLVIKHTCRLRL